MKIILIGSVDSSRVTLEELINHNLPPAMVFSLDEAISENVSGYSPIHNLAQENGIPYRIFRKINDPKNIDTIREIQPDYIFVVGLSQLISPEILSIPRQAAIGFHPAPLPKFRGRAALVWQILLGVQESKCSLFILDEGMDSGDLIGQQSYEIKDTDYASDVTERVMQALRALLRRVIPQLQSGSITRTKQDDSEATYLLKRTPEDGLINWGEPIDKIHTLIRATSRPYPGTFSMYEGKHQVIFWRAEMSENQKYIGIPGQIAHLEKGNIWIICKDGLLRVTDFENKDLVKLIPGHKFR